MRVYVYDETIIIYYYIKMHVRVRLSDMPPNT